MFPHACSSTSSHHVRQHLAALQFTCEQLNVIPVWPTFLSVVPLSAIPSHNINQLDETDTSHL